MAKRNPVTVSSKISTAPFLLKLQNHPIIDTINNQGQKVLAGVQKLIESHDISHLLSITGHVMRYITLADQLNQIGNNISFICYHELTAELIQLSQ